MRVAVDGDAVGLAFPGAHRRLEIVNVVVHVDLVLDPVRHFGCQSLAKNITFKGRAHLDDVEIDGSRRDGLLQARIVIGLSEVDPIDGSAGVILP